MRKDTATIKPAQAVPGSEVLSAFLHFREQDMKLWRRASAQLGLSATSVHVLSAVARAHERGETVRAGDLCERLGYSPAGMSVAVKALVNQGLIEQVPVAEDRRTSALVPAEGGCELIAQVRHHDEFFRGLVDGLDAPTAAAVERVLRRMGDYSAGRLPEA